MICFYLEIFLNLMADSQESKPFTCEGLGERFRFVTPYT